MLSFLRKYYYYFPIIGLTGYVVFFLIATTMYPGGSINYNDYIGHSYFHNFLCDLMLPHGKNGELNPAKPFAITAHMFLSFAMISFFYLLPEIFNYKNRNTKLIQILGMISMTVFIFMYTEYHDFFVLLTGIFGIATLIPYFVEIRKFNIRGFRYLSYICIILSLTVFASFQSKIGFYYLPFLQKITFVIDGIWVIWVCQIVASENRTSMLVMNE